MQLNVEYRFDTLKYAWDKHVNNGNDNAGVIEDGSPRSALAKH